MDEDEQEERNDARKLLQASGLCFDRDEIASEKLTFNFNDVWCWACAEPQEVEDHELVEVARLFRDYGWCGILFWASKKQGGQRSEFHDNNRFIDFVENEERIRREIPESNRRAYHKASYTLEAR